MKEAELFNLWDNPDMKLISWCFSYPGLSCLFWLWDLWSFSTADASGCRGEGGEQEALLGNCYSFVCIKVVSPRGSCQEYRQGVLSTWAHICPEAEQGADTETCHPAGADQQPQLWVLFCLFWFLAMRYCKMRLACIVLWHLTPCHKMLSSHGVHRWQKKIWEKWQSVCQWQLPAHLGVNWESQDRVGIF